MQRREVLAVSALVLVALGLRLLVALAPRCIATDGVAYLELAEQIAAGGGWQHPMFPPGYPLLVAAVHLLTGISFERSALLLSAVCGALVLLPAHLFWRRVVGRDAALASAALLAVWPLSVRLGGSVLTESASLLGIFAGLWAWQRSREGEVDWAATAGGCWGAVAWMRPEVLAWSAVAALLLGRRGRVGRAALLVTVSALVYLPYVVALHAQTGIWQLSVKADANLVFAQMVGQPDRERAYEQLGDRLHEGSADASLPGPAELARRVVANLAHTGRIAKRILPPVILVLVGIGAVLGWRQRKLGDWVWLALLAAAPILLLFVKPRFFYAASAVLLGLGGLAVTHAGGARRWVVVGLAGTLLVPQALGPLRADRYGAWRAAGLWLAARQDAAATVIDRKPFVAYYAGLPHVWPLPKPGLGGLRERLSAYESVVLVVDNRYFARSRPEWFEALASPPSWLEELARFEGPGGHEVRLLAACGGELLAGPERAPTPVTRASDAPG